MGISDFYYERHLPHSLKGGLFLFITKCVEGAYDERLYMHHAVRMTQSANFAEMWSKDPTIRKRQESRYLLKIREDYIDQNPTGSVRLDRPEVAQIIFDSILSEENRTMNTYAFCLMRNHYHWVVKIYERDEAGAEIVLPRLFQRLHSYWSFRINQIDGVKGRRVWQRETFDKIIRDGNHLERSINYTKNNPVKAGLVDDYEKWPYLMMRPVTESVPSL